MRIPEQLTIHRYADPESVAGALFELLQSELDWTQPQTWLLPGGSSPGRLFDQIVGSGRDLSQLTLLATDERLVPKTDERSNYRLLVEHFLKNELPAAHRPTVCVFYDTQYNRAENNRLLRQQLDHLPPLTLALMGIGTDGHTASLFPHKSQNALPDDWIYSHYDTGDGLDRISLGREYLNRAERMIFLCPGEKKRPILKRVLEGEYDPDAYPVQWFFRHFPGRMELFCQ